MAEYGKKIPSNLEGVDKEAYENEKSLLQRSAVLAEQRASGLQELWRSCKADLAAARLSAAQANALLTTERTKVRQAKDENADLIEKISGKEEEIKNLSENIQNLSALILELKKEISLKDNHIQLVEKEKSSLLIELKKKDEEIKKKDAELHCEMLKTEELNEKVEQLAIQMKTLQEKLDKWPLFFSTNWTLSNNITNLYYNVTKAMYRKVLRVASIFSYR